ncbi:MAG: apolipoprotein N-acyltransferase [Kiritimatiellae bacterium]|nr:apolipoprotein N-acyltransferase [Kiritimatiellia bacterium]
MTFAFLRTYTSWYLAGSICSGILLAAAFPPFEWGSIAWVAFIPLILVLRNMSARQAFGWGWLSGMVFWLISISWLLRLAFTGTNFIVAISAWILLSAYCALYTGAFAMVITCSWQVLGTEREWRPIGLVIVAPIVWVGFEYLRSTLFTGFAWNTLGVSQYRLLPIIQVAEFGGVYAVSAFVILINTALMLTGIRFWALFRRKRARKINVEMMIAVSIWGIYMWCYFDAVKAFSRLNKQGTAVRIASVQPNIPQYKKWPLQYENEIYTKVKDQTELAMSAKPDLIVWPETVVPSLIKRDPGCSAFVTELARRGSPILVGSLDCEVVGDSDIFFNSSILIDAAGRIGGQYNKRHLVPFGEYLPFERTFPFIQKLAPLGYSCTPGTFSTVFRLEKPAIAFSSLICFEDTVAGLARESVKNGARLLINQTNDAWFDGSSAAIQHMAHCVFRCIENRVPAIRSANTGITCFIDSFGRIDVLKSGGRSTCFSGFTVGTLMLPPDDMALTFYTRNGDIPFALPCGVISTILLLWTILVTRKRNHAEIQYNP